MSHMQKRKVLLLCAETARHTGTVEDHISAFKRFSHHNVCILDSLNASKLAINLSMFDVVVFHYSIIISSPSYLPDAFFERLSAFRGTKILFIQDEFRWVDRTMAAAEKLGISVLFTVVNEDVVRKIYNKSFFDNVRFEQTLTGFIPDTLIDREVPSYSNRTTDVSYRARKLPGWCGYFAQQKWQIGEQFLKDAQRYGLTCDISMSEDSRIYGERWISFMANSKAMLGTESGASFVDYSGEVYKEINAYEAANPDATFEDVRDKFLEGRDGDVVIHVISPRFFEAACLRTLMIMYPGEYSGILQARRHYLPLAPDHSNIDEVVAVLRDPEQAGEIIHNAYEEVVKSSTWTYRTFISHFDKVVGEVVPISMSPTVDIDELNQETTEISETAFQQEIQFLEDVNVRLAQKAQVKANVLALIQRAKVAIYEIISNHFPEPIARPLLRLGRAITKSLKPALKILLLGRTD